MRKLLVAVLVTASFSAIASSEERPAPVAWVGVHPSVRVTVRHDSTPNNYYVSAVISDLRTGNVLAEPHMLVLAGEPAMAKVGSTGTEGEISVSLTVTVAASGETADYSCEIKDNSVAISAQSGTLAVAR